MEILNNIFYMSIFGTVMFFIYLIFKPLTKNIFNSSWHYKMLILILCFYIVPVSNYVKLPVKEISEVSNLKTKETRSSNNLNSKEEVNFIEGHKNIEKETTVYTLEDKAYDKNTNTIEIERQSLKYKINLNKYKNIILYFWIIGAAGLFLFRIIPYLRFKFSVRKDSNYIQDEEVINLFNKCKNELKINTKLELKTYKRIKTPMLIGIFYPVVLVSDINLNHKELKMIFLHELNHYKSKDIIIKTFALIINSIHWFNPLIYILLKEMDKYCEYSIDEKVVEDMDKTDRKYYGTTILNLISNSRFDRTFLTTAMGNGGKQLKSRLENMIYSLKTTRKNQLISLIAGFLILTSGFLAGCSILPNSNSENGKSFVVYNKADGLYYSYIDEEEEIKIHDGKGFLYPLISKEGNYIAYTKDNSIYIYSLKDKSYEQIDDDIVHTYVSYVWIDDKSLIYGSQQRLGFTLYNVRSKEKTSHLDDAYYMALFSSNDKKIYASRSRIREDDYIINEGIVEIDLKHYDKDKKQFSTNIIVKGKESTAEAIGYHPVVWKISEDGRYLYIMEIPDSSSLSSDGINLAVYDLHEKTYAKYENMEILAYKNYLAVNPMTNMIGFIEGVGRDVIKNKRVKIYNVSNGTIDITDEDFVAMTPSFTLDGKKLLYSASDAKAYDTIIDYNQTYENMENLSFDIYEYDFESSKIRKITKGNHFNFMPMDISNQKVLFIRYKGNGYFSLIKIVDEDEEIFADNIVFNDVEDSFGYYGHINTEMGLDIFISNKDRLKNNNKKEEEFKDTKLDELYKLKGTYIGDNVRVANIISYLDFPEDLTVNGMELFTKEEPYGLQINFISDPEIQMEYLSMSSDYIWRSQSMILFSLIHNLDYIQYAINDGEMNVVVMTIDRDACDKLNMSQLGYRTLEVTQSKELYKQFYEIWNDSTKTKENE